MLKIEEVNTNMKIALCTIVAEWDDPYMDEWIKYHKKLGFNQIYLGLNNWTEDKFNSKLNQFVNDDIVKIIRWDGLMQQVPYYNNILHSSDSDWLAIIDLDEFIVLKQHNNINDFLSVYNQYPSLSLSWKLFGSNGLEKVVDNNFSVIQRFTKSQIGINKHIKTILNLKLLHTYDLINDIFMLNPHCANIISISPEMQQVIGPFNVNGSDSLVYIAHYITKSKEECYERRSKARADTETPRDDIEGFFTEHNLNDIENYDVVNFMNN